MTGNDFESRRNFRQLAASRTLYPPEDIRSPVMSAWLPRAVFSDRQKIRFPVLFPETNSVAEITAERQIKQTIETSDGKTVRSDLIVFYPSDSPGNSSMLYSDANGQALLQEKSLLGGTLQIRQTSAESALAATSKQSLDLDASAIIPVNRVPRISADARQLAIELEVDSLPMPEIPNGAFQESQFVGKNRQRITLKRVDRQSLTSSQISIERSAPLQPTRWMPTNDSEIIRLARSGAVGATSPSDICMRLERFVYSKMKPSAFSTVMLPADQIARTLRGDCTEHAILLATLFRVHGIRSRVVSGLIMHPRGIGFIGHAWVEAFIDDQWIPFDSTARSSRFDMTHIRLTDSELPDAVSTGIELFIPLLDLAGRSRILAAE